MYTRILVPVDGSPTSGRGLEEAVKLARLTGARLRVVHVMEQFIYAAGMDGFVVTEDMVTAVALAGEKLLKDVRARVESAAVPIESALLEGRSGRVCDAVIDEAKRWGADLIVIGTHGRRGANRFFMGSDAEMILRQAATPVLLVRSADTQTLEQN